MNTLLIEALWGQPAAGGEFLVFVIVVLFILAQVVKFFLKYQKILSDPKAHGELRQEPEKMDFSEESRPPRPVRQRKRAAQDDSPVERETERSRPKALSRELAPQGAGTRFEAAPGTLDTTSLVASSIEPTVKPNLESMTGIFAGIYEGPPGTEYGDSAMAFDLQQLIAKPEGIRQAIILAEILKRLE